MTRMSQGPARRARSRASDAVRAAVLTLALAMGILAFGPSRVVAPSASAEPLATATANPAPSATSDASATTTPDPSATSAPDPSATSTTPPAPNDPTPTSTDAPAPTSTSSPLPNGTPTPDPTPSPTPVPAPGATMLPMPNSAPASGLEAGQVLLARVTGSPSSAAYLAVDAPATGASQFQTLRVRFGITNPGETDLSVTPRLEFRRQGDTAFTPVPEKATVDVPVHVEREWVASPGGGTQTGPEGADISTGDLLTCSDSSLTPSAGHHSMAANPDATLTVPAGSCTEEEFTVGLSVDAQYLTGYELRITDGGTALAGEHLAEIDLGETPAVRLSSGQRQGTPVAAGSSSSSSAYPIVPDAAVSMGGLQVQVSRPLVAATLGAGSSSVHGPYASDADQCAVCHSAHSSQGANLLVTSGPSSTLCLTCHDGLGATTDVKTQYALTRPVNDDATREYYSHDALSPSSHTLASQEELAGVLNRHSDCADCHDSHRANGSSPSVPLTDTQTPALATGWSASGELAGVSGVAVSNGPAGSAPTYTFLDGAVQPVTHEYQLCFKCHSGYTQLPASLPGKPSTDELDKAVELNPSNPSFHPVEAAGTNQTTAMQDSLDGTSPYKLWNFSVGGTVRCLNCHASSTTPDTATDPGATLQPHTSANRGILLRNYQDRVLQTTAALYNSGDFALCYVCHAEAPFANANGPGSSTATNFNLHGLHLTQLQGFGNGGSDIDTAGDGAGNAVCAECHFRIHSTTDKVGSQQIDGSRLVNFAPDVQALVPGGPLSWTSNGAGGTCSLTCHGYQHDGLGYSS